MTETKEAEQPDPPIGNHVDTQQISNLPMTSIAQCSTVIVLLKLHTDVENFILPTAQL